MSKLRILIADDRPSTIDRAHRELIKLGHEVVVADTFLKAKSVAENEAFDVAVIDLGWSYDKSFPDTEIEASGAGWDIFPLIRTRNPDVVLFLYSAQADDFRIAERAASDGIYPIKKDYTSEGSQHFADIVKVIAYRLSIEADLRSEKDKLEDDLDDALRKIGQFEASVEAATRADKDRLQTELKNAREVIEQLEEEKKLYAEDEKRFGRVVITVVVISATAVFLLVLAWLLTERLEIAILAAVGSAFLVLAALRATGFLTSGDLDFLGTLLKDLFSKGQGKDR